MKSQIAALIPRCESISRQLRGWADSLQNSDIRGQRHLNDRSRAAYGQDRRAREFLDKLQQIRAAGSPAPANPDPKSEI